MLYGLNWAKADIVARVGGGDLRGLHRRHRLLRRRRAPGRGHLRHRPHRGPRAGCCGTSPPIWSSAYDADDAGQNAALKIYQWEDSYEIRLSVADLPPGQDPADVGLDDPARLAAAVAGPGRSWSSGWSGSCGPPISPVSKGGRRRPRRPWPSSPSIPNDLVRDQYLMQLAERVGIDVDRLRRAAPTAAGPAVRAARSAASGDAATASPTGPGPRGGRSVAGGRPRAGARGRPARRRAVRRPGRAARRSGSWRPRLRSTRHSRAPEVRSHDLLQRLAVEDLPWGDDPTTYATSVLVQLVEAAAARGGWPLWFAPATTAPAS